MLWYALGGVALWLYVADLRERALQASIAVLLRSAKAEAIGDLNQPNADQMKRLRYTAQVAPVALAVAMEAAPGAAIGSGFRNLRVNAAVGGVAGSAHTLGLAFDLSGIGRIDQTRFTAQHLRAQIERLPPAPARWPWFKRVLAEDDHIHITLNDPFGAHGPYETTRWREEQIGDPRFVPLRQGLV